MRKGINCTEPGQENGVVQSTCHGNLIEENKQNDCKHAIAMHGVIYNPLVLTMRSKEESFSSSLFREKEGLLIKKKKKLYGSS